MDELIERAFRGEASVIELEQLAAWRQRSAENEVLYQQLVRLLEAAHGLGEESRNASPPPTVAALLAHGRDRRAGVGDRASRFAAKRWIPWAAAAAALLLLALDLAHSWTSRTDATVASAAAVVTGPSELATIELGDGSVVRLAPSSRLHLSQGGDPRSVHLDGRAFFSVAKMPDHPFRVRTSFASATVLGTRFEVATEKSDLRLIVVEGRVALSAGGRRVEVQAGEESQVTDGVASPPVLLGSPDSLLTWVGKFLAFQSTPLQNVATELERMYDVHVMIADPVLARRTVTATFTDQNLAQVLEVVCSVTRARCESQGGVVTISQR